MVLEWKKEDKKNKNTTKRFVLKVKKKFSNFEFKLQLPGANFIRQRLRFIDFKTLDVFGEQLKDVETLYYLAKKKILHIFEKYEKILPVI